MRIDCNLIPQGVKFNRNPISGTRAIDKPKLSATLSILSIPRFVFFVGKSAKTKTYPGIKIRKGKPKIVLMILFIEYEAIGSIIILHRKQRDMSIGNFVNDIFIGMSLIV